MALNLSIILIFTLLASELCNASASIPTRSRRYAKWEDHIHAQHRQRRSNANEWQITDTCTLSNLMTYDALGRRRSGLLATPQAQGNCGSCWAFAAAHTLTDQLSITARSRQPLLSSEYLTRCIRPGEVENGCCGASSHEEALDQLINPGTYFDSCLPYSLKNYPPQQDPDLEAILYDEDDFKKMYKIRNPLSCSQQCSVRGQAFTNTRAMDYSEITEDEVIASLAMGPVYTHMHTTTQFGRYRCGVYCGPPISIANLPNHAVEIVDYSNSSYPGTPYWVVKNSWGTDFGESGYFRIARNQRQLYGFFTVSLSSQGRRKRQSTLELNSGICMAENVNNLTDPFIIMAAEFAIEELNDNSLIVCDDTSRTATVTQTSLVNATMQSVDGFLLTIAITAEITGCAETETATILFNIDYDMDGSFTLTGYNYDSGVTTTAASIFTVMLLTFFPLITYV